jgi:endo-1,4-beta-xylanase
MTVGTILNHKYFNGVVSQEISDKYKDIALKYFSNFGMYATGIFGMIAKGPNIETDYDWRNTDLLVNFATENNLNIHFNTVITGHLDAFPDWYKELDSKDKYLALEKHVRAVINRYKGRVSYFKLVNEMVREPGDNFLGTGRDKVKVIADIFKWAVDEYPEGRYMLNEYGCLIREDIREPFLKLVDDIKELGGRIDIIGEQAHSGYQPRPFYLPPDDLLSDSLDEIYDSTRLPIMITEFDMGPKNGEYEGGSIDPHQSVKCDTVTYSTWYEYQGFAYKHFMELCQRKGYIESFYYWNLVDDPSMTWERDECGLFNQMLKPKVYMYDLLMRLEKENGD